MEKGKGGFVENALSLPFFALSEQTNFRVRNLNGTRAEAEKKKRIRKKKPAVRFYLASNFRVLLLLTIFRRTHAKVLLLFLVLYVQRKPDFEPFPPVTGYFCSEK